MNKKALFALVLVLAVLPVLTGCGSGTATGTTAAGSQTVTPSRTSSQAASPNSTLLPLPQVTGLPTPAPAPSGNVTTVGGPFLPGEVMAGLPVYPGATPTTELNPNDTPAFFPMSVSAYGTLRPGYQSAFAEYSAQAAGSDILSWYLGVLEAKGYGRKGGGGGDSPTFTWRGITFSLPSQPSVTVEVHVYNSIGSPTPTVIELLVTRVVPIPHPAEELLPDDIDRVAATYAPGTATAVTKTFTDSQTIDSLLNLFNGLPQRPDYITTGPPIGVYPQTLFTLVFHSRTKGDLTVTDVTYQGIRLGNYPVLDDPQDVFLGTVKQLLGS